MAEGCNIYRYSSIKFLIFHRFIKLIHICGLLKQDLLILNLIKRPVSNHLLHLD